MEVKVLLIEDNEDIRENTAELLELSGYHVNSASNGKEGVKLAQEDLPDIIICDIMMPDLDGYGVLHILSRNPNTQHIPFIFLTAKVEKEDFRKGMNLGADDYLTKPFDETDLLDAIESRLNRNKMLSHKKRSSMVNSLSELAEKSKTKTFANKERIFREGDYPNHLYYIESGKIKLFRLNDDGKEFITGYYGKGDFIGQTAIIENTNHTDFATAIDETVLRTIPRISFLECFEGQSEAVQEMLKLVAGELDQKEQQLISLAYDTVRKRVADALVGLEAKYKKQDEKHFTIKLPRQDLANMVGTATESVIRILSEFKEDEAITVKGSNITVLDTEKLKAVLY